jgi:hypothetical protein
VLRRSYHI